MSLADRLWSKVIKGPGCWIFTGARAGWHSRYGHLRVGPADKGYVYAHRLAYELAKGTIPEGLEVDHRCRNPRCVRPGHLRVVTHRVNLLSSPDTQTSKAAARTRCPHGHLLKPKARVNLARNRRWCPECNRKRCLDRYWSNPEAAREYARRYRLRKRG